MGIIVPISAVALIVIFVAYVCRGQIKMSCPECNNSQVRTVDKQLKELKQDQTMGYAVKLDVKLIIETRYRCQACSHSWTVIAPET
jgi:transposase-like protein